MQMSADLFRMLHHLNEFLRQILGMGSHESDPLQAFDLLHFLQKLRKGNGVLQILAVGIHILSEQHDLHHTVRHQAFNLPNDILRITAAFPAADIGDNTIAAEIIAAEHDIDTGFERIFSLYRQIFHDLVRILPDINDHSLIFKQGA